MTEAKFRGKRVRKRKEKAFSHEHRLQRGGKRFPPPSLKPSFYHLKFFTNALDYTLKTLTPPDISKSKCKFYAFKI